VLRAQVPAAEVSAICRRLTEGRLPPAGPHLAHAAALLLDSDPVDLDPELLTVAAEQACAAADHPQAERLARAAVGRGGGFRAHLALVEAVRWQGRPTEAAELAHAAAGLAGTDQERARLAVTRSLTACCGLGRVNEAETALQEARAGVRDTEARRELAGAAALLALLGGDPRRAVRIAGEESATADRAPAHPLAAAAAAGGLAAGGRVDEALAAVASGRDVLERLPAHLAMLPATVLDHAETLALWLRGRIGDLAERAAEFHRRTMAAPASPRDAYAALNQGWAALAAGRPRSAVRWLGEAVALLRRCDPAGLLPLGATNLALARALLGEVDAARELLADAAGESHPAAVVLQPQAQMAEAWIAATVDRTAEAADLAVDAAQLAAASGQRAVEAVVLHDAVRFGHPARVRGRLRALADELGCPLVEAFAQHCEAAADGSAADLEEAGRRFADMGARLLAAEAIAEAAAAHARAGNRGIASARSADAMRLVQACEGAQSPSLARLDAPHLTPREEEVALLAEDGLDNQSIARRLVLSVRTVEKHLENAYTKLGIGSRSELRAALGSPVSAVSEAVSEQRRSGRDSAAAQYRRLRVH
jgi:DNA-binding CsgD family transcriptional regulator